MSCACVCCQELPVTQEPTTPDLCISMANEGDHILLQCQQDPAILLQAPEQQAVAVPSGSPLPPASEMPESPRLIPTTSTYSGPYSSHPTPRYTATAENQMEISQ